MIDYTVTNNIVLLGRCPNAGEFGGKVAESVLVHGMDRRFYKYINGSVVAVTHEEKQAIEESQQIENQKKLIAAQRYAIETGGVMFGECQILTDRESQQILDSAIEKIRRGIVESIVWKCGNGKWLTIDGTNAAQIEGLVLMHVQSAFAWEKSELEKLEE